MKSELEKHFSQGNDTLEDLYKIGGTNLAPLLDRVQFHFSEIKRTITMPLSKLKQDASLSNLETLFINRVEEDVIKCFSEAGDQCQLNFLKDYSKMNLYKWDKLVKLLPIVFIMPSLFRFSGRSLIEINEKSIKMEGEVELNLDFTSIKEEVYGLTRILFGEKVLLTFDVFEASVGDKFILSLKFDYSHQENLFYTYSIGKNLNKKICFSNIFTDYKATPEGLLEVGGHICFQVLRNGKLLKLKQLPSLVFNDEWCGEIIHFPFLFRPVSIIIDSKGTIYDLSLLNELGISGRSSLEPLTNDYDGFKDKVEQQDVKKIHTNESIFIDLFSIFNS